MNGIINYDYNVVTIINEILTIIGGNDGIDVVPENLINKYHLQIENYIKQECIQRGVFGIYIYVSFSISPFFLFFLVL